MKEYEYIARKEHYGWLLFHVSTRDIQRVSHSVVQDFKKKGVYIRELQDSQIEGALSAPIKLFLDVTNHCNDQRHL